MRYDDAQVDTDTRWTGYLVLAPGLSAGVSGANLTINKGGTPNCHLPTTTGDFINPTRVLCPAGTTVHQNAGPLDIGSSVSLEGDKTTFQVAGTVQLASRGNTFTVGTGTLLELCSGSVFQLDSRSQLVVAAGGTLLLHEGGPVRVSLQDLSGVPRLTLEPRPLVAGRHKLDVPLRGVPTGVYLLVVDSPEGRQVTRLQVNH